MLLNKYSIEGSLFLFFCRVFHLKFSARQNYPPRNDGYDSYSLNPDYQGSYFYGTYKELEKFHRRK